MAVLRSGRCWRLVCLALAVLSASCVVSRFEVELLGPRITGYGFLSPHRVSVSPSGTEASITLVRALTTYIDDRNRAPRPFVWTATVQDILANESPAGQLEPVLEELFP